MTGRYFEPIFVYKCLFLSFLIYLSFLFEVVKMKGPHIVVRQDLFDDEERGESQVIGKYVDSDWGVIEDVKEVLPEFLSGGSVAGETNETATVIGMKVQCLSVEESACVPQPCVDTEQRTVSEPSPAYGNCFVVQNGKVTKPFYIVKKKDLDEGKGEVQETSSNQSVIKVLKNARGNSLPSRGKTVLRKEEKKQPAVRRQEAVRRTCPRDWKGASAPEQPEGEDLMWLLDFKLDDLFGEGALGALPHLDDGLDQFSEFPGKFVDVDGSVSNFSESDGDRLRVEIGCQTETSTTKSHKAAGQKAGVKMKVDPRSEPTRTFSDLRYNENRKPPFTYTELIECALQEKGPLTVSEIYHWISETFPYYKSWDDRWKNSVRHNLSINPYFRKGTKARQGSGHLWTVNKSEDNAKMNSWKRQRFQEFEEFNKRLRLSGEADKAREAKDPAEISPCSLMIDETELATASIEDKENRRLHRDVLMAACLDTNLLTSPNVSLEQSAEEILSGVKKNVEVQYLEPVKANSADNDFLNPISKEVLMGECGLLNQIELNLTSEGGDHVSVGLVDAVDTLELEELSFHYPDISSHHSSTAQLLSLVN